MTEKNWIIRAYEPGDEEGIVSLFNEVFSEVNPDFEHRTMDEWYWQFRDSPLGNQTSVAIDDDGKVIGQYTSIPFPTWLRGEVQVTSQIVDSCVAAEYRRSLKREGVFLSVATRYFDIFAYGHPTVLCYGYPVPNAQRIGVRFLGYIPVLTPVQKMINILDEERVTIMRNKAAEAGVEVQEVKRFDDRVDALWERLKPGIGYSLVRNARFYNWRYCDHPRVDYHCLIALRDGEMAGLLVYRLGWINDKITPIVDLLSDPDDEPVQAQLTAAAARHAIDSGNPRLEMWLPPNGRWFRTFPSYGFVQENTRFNMINRLFGDWMNEEWLMANYFFCMGDSDIY
ncbi:MAG: GNAT family N-acetyltransferase [Planctomycetota bacterium]